MYQSKVPGKSLISTYSILGVVANLSLSGSGRKVWWGGRLFEAWRLLTFSAFRMGAYSRWALIRGWALIRINTVFTTRFVTNNSYIYIFFNFVLNKWRELDSLISFNLGANS